MLISFDGSRTHLSCCRNQSFLNVGIYPQYPPTREHIKRLSISPHWNLTTAGISPGCPHCLSLWLDRSIIILPVCHRFRWVCLSTSEPWRFFKTSAHLACPSRTTGRKYLVCWYSFFKVQHYLPLASTEGRRGKIPPLPPVSHFFLGFTTKY